MDKNQYKVAFKTPFGTFIPTVMTFGFCNAPSIFQQAMNQDLAEFKQKYPENVSNYMDDVAIGTDDSPAGIQLHKEIVHCFLAILKRHAYFLKLSKCKFKKKEMEFLGFWVGNRQVRVDSSKISRIKDWPLELKNVKQIRQILRVLGYQCAFIARYAQKAKPLMNLLKKGIKFLWDDTCKEALKSLIECIAKDPILEAPQSNQPYELETDASTYGVGVVLFQKDERGKCKAIGYTSRSLNQAERNYNIWDREFLGLIFGLTYWRHLLCGTKELVQVYVNHANLLHYRHPQKVNRRVARYILTLADYNIQLHHRAGLLNQADELSR